MMALLDTDDLIRALALFGDRYHAVEVFADDLSDTARQDVEARPVLNRNGRTYRYTVFPERGVIRFEIGDPSATAQTAAVGAALGAAVGAATREKGEAMLGGALLGLLVGGLIGAAKDSSRPRRIFALQLDPETRDWKAYDGTLLRWMKDRLLVPNSAEG